MGTSEPPLRRPVTLLHLTDLHLCARERAGHYWNTESPELALSAHDQRGLVGGLARDLERLHLAPDLVIVTGDLLDRGSDTGVPMAVELLSGLADRLNLPRNYFVLIPGNHDVLRAPDPAQRYALFDELCRQFYGALHAPLPPGTPAHLRVEYFNFSKLGLEVLGFNSCEALEPSANQEHGSIGAAQRDRADALLDTSEPRGLFRVAAMHHHLESPVGTIRGDYSVMDDAALTRRWLARRRFRIALHGHQHVDWQSTHVDGDWALAIVAGGSAGVARYGREAWQLHIGYQVIVVETLERGKRIRREYDPQSREWIDAGRGVAVELLRFGAAFSPGAAETSVGAARRPTAASVRRLLGVVLKSAEDFDAFCHDHFESVHQRFSSGMNRVQRTTTLFTHVNPAEVLEALRKHDPDALCRHEGLLQFDP